MDLEEQKTNEMGAPDGSGPSAAVERVESIAAELMALLIKAHHDTGCECDEDCMGDCKDDAEAVMGIVRPRLDKLGRVIDSLARRLAVRFESETKMRDTLAALFIVNDWRKTTQHLSLEQRETWADACDHWASPPVDRWWRRESEWDSAAAAFGRGDVA